LIAQRVAGCDLLHEPRRGGTTGRASNLEGKGAGRVSDSSSGLATQRRSAG
jgi:hypothetical protein